MLPRFSVCPRGARLAHAFHSHITRWEEEGERALRTRVLARANTCELRTRTRLNTTYWSTILQAGHQALKDKYGAAFGGKAVIDIRRLVYKWTKKLAIITKQASNSRTSSMMRLRVTGVGTILSPAAEEVIVAWINELRRDGIPVSSGMLTLKALEVAAQHGVPDGIFSASNTWKGSFLRRHRLSFRAKNRAGQASPDVDAVIGQAFAAEVRAWMEEHGTTRVYNADQTGVNFEMLPKRTISDRGAATVWVKCGKKEKQRATAMLLADSDGNKYDPFLVFKTKKSAVPTMQVENDKIRHGFGKNLWTEILDLQSATGAQIYGNPTAWWNEDITVAWLEYFFGDRTLTSEPVLLLLDSFSGHWTDKVVACADRLNVKLKSVPPKLTWRCQPADVAWMKPLKDGLRRKWVDHLRQQLSRRADRTRRFIMRPPDRGDVTEWLLEGWLGLTDKIIISGFSKCGFRDPVQDPAPDAHPPEEDEYDTTTLISELENVGYVDRTVGEIRDGMDIVDGITEAIV